MNLCFVLIWEKQQLMSFLFKIFHLNFHSFLGFQNGSDSSIKAIIPLSATLPLAIGLNFLVRNSIVISKVNHTWISFLNPKDQSNPTKPVFERILTKAFFQCTLNLVSKLSFLGVSEQNSANLVIT